MELRLDSGVHVYVVQCGTREDADSSPLLWYDAVCGFAYFAINFVLVFCFELIMVPSGAMVAVVYLLIQSLLARWAWCCLVWAAKLWVRRYVVHLSTLQALLKESRQLGLGITNSGPLMAILCSSGTSLTASQSD